MRTKYETLDGHLFNDSYEAEKHEAAILKQVRMWDFNKNPTILTHRAAVVHLTGEGAGAIFRAMVAANEEELLPLEPSIIDDDDAGWFYWDEYSDTYRYIDPNIIDIFIAANHQI